METARTACELLAACKAGPPAMVADAIASAMSAVYEVSGGGAALNLGVSTFAGSSLAPSFFSPATPLSAAPAAGDGPLYLARVKLQS